MKRSLEQYYSQQIKITDAKNQTQKEKFPIPKK